MAKFFRNFGRTHVKDSNAYVYHLGMENNNSPGSDRTYTIDECTPWVGRRALVNLQKFRGNTVGTIKYIGQDPHGVLCAGIEFDNFIGGMSGKVNGQKLFKCKEGHGLLVPVERVHLMNQSGHGSEALNRTKSMPNINRINNQQSSPERKWILTNFVPVEVPYLNIGDNVVWLGGASPATGIVRWIGKEGSNSPLRAWLEMDELIGYGNEEQMVCINFGCERGRGRLLPLEELLLLTDFLATEEPTSSDTNSDEINRLTRSVSNFDSIRDIPRSNTVDSGHSSNCNVGTLIDLEDTPIQNTNMTLADTDFFVHADLMNRPTTISSSNNGPINPFNTPSTPSAPAQTLLGVRPSNNSASTASTNPFKNNDYEDPPAYNTLVNVNPPGWAVADTSGIHQQTDEARGYSPTPNSSATLHNKIAAVELPRQSRLENSNDLPLFIVPQINIHEFYKVKGYRGIQGYRNSCYVDVVLFSMFGFTNIFDSRMLQNSGRYSNQADSPMTREARKILAEGVVNPLRSQYYCAAEGVTRLRDALKDLSDKLDGAFMDVEEFMLMLFDKVFHLEEFIHYDTEVKDYMHQINLGTNEQLARVNTISVCLKHSMAEYQLKFHDIPAPALIIQMPRMAGQMVEDAIIIPTLTLNISTLMSKKVSPTRGTLLNLLAVICIHDYHYTAFIKCGEGALSHWVYYDSNPFEGCPKIEILPKMGEWLEDIEKACNESPTAVMQDRYKFHPMLQKLLSSAYVCIYYSPEVVMRENIQQ